ncbi:hypothetical protein LWF01_14785 [Saxibacter everestensis]|uniref:AbiEi antitoxin N-terminal domain-containing protein n=1 Tax=Saxibacter everestensis TaxID=2909229 RepID=A0ABY8QQS1_9MICO|nr:hypothetical protein LWF01_14785 [Brevibacteriaceae bacterium ZFBP1038]
MDPSSLLPEVVDTAGSQHGILTSQDAADLLGSRSVLAGYVRRGQLYRIGRGVYVLPDVWNEATPGRRKWLQAVGTGRREADAGGGGALSHGSAALLWGLPLLSLPRSTHLTRSGTNSRKHVSELIVHTSALDGEVATESGVPVTSIARTAVDCAAASSFTQALMVGDAALRLLLGKAGERLGRDRELPTDRIEEIRLHLLTRLEERRLRGRVTARKAIAAANPLSGSAAESRARAAFISLKLPAPTLQMKISTRMGVCYPDFAFRSLGVLVEVDGLVKLADPYSGSAVEALRRERQRENALTEAGWEVLRLSWQDLGDRDAVGRRIMAAHTRARGRGIAGRDSRVAQ